MTIVPKKKSDHRSANKQGQGAVESTAVKSSVKHELDEEGGHRSESDPGQQGQQQPLEATNQVSGSAAAAVAAVASQMLAGADATQESGTDEFTGYGNNNNNSNNNSSGDGEEHTHDRRQYHHQQQPHHHHHHHPHNKYANSKMSDSESNVNHVILITVINPHYPITCDLIHQICSTYGKVNRIVIFKKNGVQTMVEFDTIESAKRARSLLHGCDIYSGCCTLKVEYAKTPKLNVHKNDSESFDYTNPNLGTGPNHALSESSASGDASNQSQQQQQHNHGMQGAYGHGSTASHHQHHQHREAGGMIKRGAGGPSGGGGDGPVGQGNSGAHGHQSHHHHASQFHPAPPHMQAAGSQHHSKNQHPAQGVLGSGQHHGGLQSANFMMGQPLDQSGSNSAADSAGGSFHHQDGGFNLSRGNVGGGAQAGGSNTAPTFIGPMDTFSMPGTTSGSGPHQLNPHGMQGSLYGARPQEGHHHQQQQHSQHHHSTQSHQYQSSRGGGGSGPTAGGSRGHNPHHNPSFPAQQPLSATNPLMAGGSHIGPQGTVMMVYGLGIERVNCDRLFNLFCLYGNVIRVKFLRSKEGCAMVQMGDVIAVDRCVSSLNKITLFGNEMQISYSKQPFLHDVLQPFTLPDGEPSFKDFMVNKNNRFRNPEVASKNKILPPSRILHFFNAPYGISDDELIMIFKETSGHEPVTLKIFTPKVENAKSFSGLVTFRDPTEATEALVLCNHLSLPKAGAPHPYILRLCFSPPAYT